MNFREPFGGHLGLSVVGGVFSIFAASAFLHLTRTEILFAPCLFILGGLAPDTDTQSTPSKWSARIGVVASVVLIHQHQPIYATMIGIVFMLTKSGKHRGWTHSIWLPMAISLAGWYVGAYVYAFSFAGGLMLHIAADRAYSKMKRAQHF